MKRTLLLSFLLLPIVSSAAITKTLSLGSTNLEVRYLQIILNSDPYTQIASVGPGSPGQESSYFGGLTNQAVMKFQTKYAAEVLFPSGIYKPTGIVGLNTRKKLNSINANTVLAAGSLPISIVPPSIQAAISLTSSSATQSTTTYSPFYQDAVHFQKTFFANLQPIFLSISSYQVKHGDVVTIQGSGFVAQQNTIHFGNQYSMVAPGSIDGKTLRFAVPDSIPNGSYNVWIENDGGSTYKSEASNFFTITDTPSAVPTITNISPSAIQFSDKATIVITGTGFMDQGNSIYSPIGTAPNLPSKDGKTISVPLASFSNFSSIQKSSQNFKGAGMNISIVIHNSAGNTSVPGSFLITF